MKNESGRTLVELISVLAIAGVLAITGIVAYHYAMVKYQANELVHLANLAYVDVLSRGSLDEITDLKITDLKGNPLKGFMYNDAGFVIAESVDKDICTRILDDKTNFSLLTTKGSNLTLCDDDTSIIFSFSNATDVGFDCQDELDCESGQYCSANLGTCRQIEECANNKIFSQTHDGCQYCYEIDTETPVFDNDTCIACGTETPFWNDDKKECVVCLTHDDCPYDNDKNICYDNQCAICPMYSTNIETDQAVNGIPCYCDSGFVHNNETNTCDSVMCKNKMIDYGYEEDSFSMNGTTITYIAGEMIVDKSLDLSGCNLTVNNVLSVSYSGNLTVDDIVTTGGVSSVNNLVSKESAFGILIYGVVTADTVTTTASDVLGLSDYHSMGITVVGKLNATDINATAGYGNLSYGINIQSTGVINAENITATGVDCVLLSDGICNSGGKIYATTIVAISNTASVSRGIRNDGTIEADTITAISKGGTTRYSFTNSSVFRVNTLNYCPSIQNVGTFTNNGGTYKATLMSC